MHAQLTQQQGTGEGAGGREGGDGRRGGGLGEGDMS